MRILSIETSCDETAVSIVEATAPPEGGAVEFSILGNSLLSQIELHKEYGGVFPTVAKREHARNLIPLLKQVLSIAGKGLSSRNEVERGETLRSDKLKKIFEREPELLKQFLEFIPTIETPEIDAIAVTAGPGLEPALWVGINFAQALALAWEKPIIPVNHMEGHIFSALLEKKRGKDEFSILNFQFPKTPMLALLISGGHTQLILSKKFLEYEIIGETLDDAVGEAFDKVARMLGLPYPGGPEISKLAEKQLSNPVTKLSNGVTKLPRPMLHSDTCDFSFSGLKTAVLYTLKKIPDLTDEIKQKVAKEFEDAVIEVLLAKTKKAMLEYEVKTLVIGGGVSANKKIRNAFEEMLKKEFHNTALYMPSIELSTDNAIMIAVVSYFRFVQNQEKYKKQNTELKADGNLSL